MRLEMWKRVLMLMLTLNIETCLGASTTGLWAPGPATLMMMGRSRWCVWPRFAWYSVEIL